MGKKAPKAPAPPDPLQSAQAQAQVNRLNQFFPGGGSMLYGRYSADGNFTPDYNHSALQLVESPYQQQTRAMGENLSLQLASLLGGNLNLPQLQTGINFDQVSRLPRIDDFSADAARVERAAFDRTKNLLQPEFEKKRAKTNQALANQGIPLGAEAFDGEFNRLDKAENEALQAAASDAVAQGRSEQQRLLSNALALRQSQINDQLQSVGLNNSGRATYLQELASLLGGQNFAPTQFNGMMNPPPIDVMGAINNNYMGQLNTYNNRVGQQQSLLRNVLGGGLFSFF